MWSVLVLVLLWQSAFVNAKETRSRTQTGRRGTWDSHLMLRQVRSGQVRLGQQRKIGRWCKPCLFWPILKEEVCLPGWVIRLRLRLRIDTSFASLASALV